MDIVYLIDRLEELVAQGTRVPMGSGVVIHRQRLLDLIDRLRVTLPADVRESREIVQRREEVLSEAQEEAARIVARAQAEVEERLKTESVVKQAQEMVREAENRAQNLVRDAEVQARERLDEAQSSADQEAEEADLYALQTLRRLETQLNNFLNAVQKAIQTMEERKR